MKLIKALKKKKLWIYFNSITNNENSKRESEGSVIKIWKKKILLESNLHIKDLTSFRAEWVKTVLPFCCLSMFKVNYHRIFQSSVVGRSSCLLFNDGQVSLNNVFSKRDSTWTETPSIWELTLNWLLYFLVELGTESYLNIWHRSESSM